MGACIINIDEHESTGTHFIALYVNGDKVTYSDSFEVNIFQKKFKKSLEIKILQQILIEYKHTIQ